MRIQFVTGKGGVGKTRTSLLLSKLSPQSALAETSAGLFAESKDLGISIPPVFRFSRQDLAEDFLLRTVKIGAVAKLLSQNKLFQILLQLSPNLNEMLLLRKWMEISEEQPLIVDAPSTGHFINFLDAIKTAQSLFDGGSLKAAADDVDKLFSSPGSVEVVIVSLPEKSALDEMSQIEKITRERYPQMKIRKILNRKHLPPQTELKLSDALRDLAFVRPQLESERIQNLSFEHTIHEGQSSL